MRKTSYLNVQGRAVVVQDRPEGEVRLRECRRSPMVAPFRERTIQGLSLPFLRQRMDLATGIRFLAGRLQDTRESPQVWSLNFNHRSRLGRSGFRVVLVP